MRYSHAHSKLRQRLIFLLYLMGTAAIYYAIFFNSRVLGYLEADRGYPGVFLTLGVIMLASILYGNAVSMVFGKMGKRGAGQGR